MAGFREDQTGEGFVYILVTADPDLPNRIKVGLSVNPEERRRNLSGSSVAFPYIIAYAWAVSDMARAEHIAHLILEGHRLSSNREYFDIIPRESILGIMRDFGDDMSQEDILENCLQSIFELIEMEYELQDFDYYSVDVSQFTEYHKQWIKTRAWPENPNRFAPLF